MTEKGRCKHIQTSLRLTAGEAAAVKQLIESGEYSSASEVLRDGLRQIRRSRGLINYSGMVTA